MCGACLSVSTGPRGSSIVGRRQSEDGSHRSETCTRSTTCGVSESVSLLSISSLVLFLLTVYKSLKDRHDTRLGAWAFPGWDECVRRTGEGPLPQYWC